MSISDKALWVIERNSDRDLTLAAIAARCGVSRSHLANAFGTATGCSIMKYLRARRLSEAARQLAAGAPDILRVALDAGYSSHEAFTRAFREQFAVTPETLRDRKSLNELPLIDPPELTVKAPGRDAPRIVRAERMLIVGLAHLCSWETTGTIPGQWQRFMPYFAAIPARLACPPVGISRTLDEEGRFQYICGAEVARFDDTPKELVEVEIPARTYAVFEHKDHIASLRDTYATIWNEALPMQGLAVADAASLERHNPSFDPRTGEGGVAIWIPLES